MHTPDLYNIFKQHPVVTTDSRVCPKDSIFFALKGPTFNGNEFAEKALEKGIKTVVFDRGGYVYHGRVAALADGAREGGLDF